MAISSLTLLLGPNAQPVLAAAIAEHGATMEDACLADVRVRPGGEVRARYVASVRRPDGCQSREVLVAAAGGRLPAGAAVVAGEHRGEHLDVAVWRLAQDPALPGLQIAERPEEIAALLSGVDVTLDVVPRIRVRSYRPGQRAVLEVAGGRGRWFIKVVQPAAAGSLVLRHNMMAEGLPVPPVLAQTNHGLVLLPEASGTLLRDRLTRESFPGALPAPSGVERLLDALPHDLLQLPPRRSVLQHLVGSVEVLRHCAESDPLVPAKIAADLGSEAERIADRAIAACMEPEDAPIPVHGDLYHNQLLTEGPQITGMLDVDTAGPGQRADEWATMVGYLSVLGMSHPWARLYCDEVFAFALDRVGSRVLNPRVAGVVLALAAAPFRSRSDDWPRHAARRLALARAWL